MRLAGTVTIDVAAVAGHLLQDDHQAMRLVQDATYAPAGADVVLKVAPRQFPPVHGVAWLREHGQHLGTVTVQCSCPDTIRRWLDAVRGGDG